MFTPSVRNENRSDYRVTNFNGKPQELAGKGQPPEQNSTPSNGGLTQ
jgi:hypothetical protein